MAATFGLEDLFGALGVSCIVIGVGLWSIPAALIVLGVAALILCALIANTKAKA